MKKNALLCLIAALLITGCSSKSTGRKTISSHDSASTSEMHIASEAMTAEIQHTASDTQTRKLSQFTDEELLAFINDYEIEIPYDYRDEVRCAGFVRKIVTLVEDDPEYPFGYSYPVTVDFAEAIRNATLDYYDLNGT